MGDGRSSRGRRASARGSKRNSRAKAPALLQKLSIGRCVQLKQTQNDRHAGVVTKLVILPGLVARNGAEGGGGQPPLPNVGRLRVLLSSSTNTEFEKGRSTRFFALKQRGDFDVFAWVDDDFTGECGGLVVFVELATNRSGRVVGGPTPFADGNKMHRNSFGPAEAGALAANKKFVADANVGGDEQPRGTVGGSRGLAGLRAKIFCSFGGGGTIDHRLIADGMLLLFQLNLHPAVRRGFSELG